MSASPTDCISQCLQLFGVTVLWTVSRTVQKLNLVELLQVSGKNESVVIATGTTPNSRVTRWHSTGFQG